jgi:hypothetical protein
MSHRALGQGFAPEAGEVVSGSNNVQNARPDMDLILSCRKVTNGLWPAQQADHPLCFPAIKGELAFTFKTNESGIFETVNKRRSSNAHAGMGSFSDTLDTVFYLTTLNGMGRETEKDEYVKLFQGSTSRIDVDATTAAQRSYRNKIQFLGFVRDTVLKDHNLVDQGNTIVVSKGKITIPNTGHKPIMQGMSISWDVPLTKDYNKYGLAKWKVSEPHRYSLLTLPTNTGDASIEETVEALTDEFRSHTHKEFSRRLWKGFCGVSAAMDAQLWGAHSTLDWATDVEPIGERQAFGAAYPDPAFSSIEDFIRTKAILTLDEDDIQEHQGVTSLTFGNTKSQPKYVRNSAERASALEYLMTSRFTTQGKISRFDSPGHSFYKNLVETGLYDVVVGLNGLIVSSQERRIGIAATDAAPGNKFDIIL